MPSFAPIDTTNLPTENLPTERMWIVSELLEQMRTAILVNDKNGVTNIINQIILLINNN